MTRNFAIALDPDGQPALHRADCPVVRKLAEDGVPVLTMLDCERLPTTDVISRWHTCLEPPT